MSRKTLPSSGVLIVHGVGSQIDAKAIEELLRTASGVKAFRVFVEPIAQLNLDDLHRVGSKFMRALRYLVSEHRKHSKQPKDVLLQWAELQHKDARDVYVHQNAASAHFNSSLVYEVPVLKVRRVPAVRSGARRLLDGDANRLLCCGSCQVFAEPLLKTVPPDSSMYALARSLLQTLGRFEPLPSTLPPAESVLQDVIRVRQ
jgi:hypothetical protein